MIGLEYQFMQNAFIAAILVSIACGVVGTYIVIKRIVSLSGGISHAAFGGIGLGYFLGINPVITAIPFSIIAAFLMGVTTRKVKISEDTAIGILWSVGMSLGIIFISLTPGYASDLFNYLFGNILTVTRTDLWMMLILNLVIISNVLLFNREFTAISFDEEFSQVIGVPVNFFYLLLLMLVALSVVILIKVVGIILVIALLTIPAVTAKQFTFKIPQMMILSSIIGIIFTLTGLWLSYTLDTSSGATIVIILAIFFIITYLSRTKI
ncbi:MAG: metal ABC transporter permease [Methanobacteriales archaeon]|nr:metal ABC transporter permease [Methanobacteriales archaeon]MBC7118147.1 metal ABC transporter permease [Methanobacteriaceae archaeon]